VSRNDIDFPAIARAALPHLPVLCERWLPGGRRVGREWICSSLSGGRGQSCRVNLVNGRWCDFATGDKGGDAISLAAAVHHLNQADAAREISRMLGLSIEKARRDGRS
jgi:putative DNA primase/helicase